MYTDSCIIVKLLVPEPDSDFFEASLVGESLSTSELAWTEVWSALLAKERAGKLKPKDREKAWRKFEDMVESEQIRLLKLNTVTLKRATRILGTTHPQVPLRTLDAIHLAACDMSQDFPLCSTDKRMRDAAAILQIPLFPETLE